MKGLRHSGNRCSPRITCGYAGEPLAAIFATDPYVAEDAADLINIEVDELDAVIDAVRAAKRV